MSATMEEVETWIRQVKKALKPDKKSGLNLFFALKCRLKNVQTAKEQYQTASQQPEIWPLKTKSRLKPFQTACKSDKEDKMTYRCNLQSAICNLQSAKIII